MRNVLNFNASWLFAKQAEVPATLPADWEQVNVPHCWNAVDGQDGGNDYFRGTCQYAKTFNKADLPEADRYYLEIRGANSSADVTLNGKKIAHHDGGYSTWRVEMTDHLRDENLLVISVDNTANETVYPQMADFTFYGGLYRDVNIICVNRSHFDLDYYGAPGIKVTPVMDGNNANVEVEVFITDGKDGQSVHYAIYDKNENLIAEVTTADTKANFTIENAHKWHGRKDPYLYCCEAELLEGEQVIDSVCTRFGCRSFQIDANRGFILNGEEYPLRGVSRHQDRWGKGNALSKEDHIEDMDLICEVGATTIRLAHYQHDQFFYDLCDERGLVIWAEIPYISKHMPTGRENTVSQMKELISQNYNHPSIVVWGLSNEISMKGDRDPDLLENHNILNDLCHEMD
ncbi:MAG: glycoside hydrolase family 2 protein, partial [Oscillospiraceae bacterium]|nr:glycoside hydrolase family 2 protein [Oscillospiraceae bacterium]